MLNKTIRDFINIFVIAATFTITSFSNVFALADRAKEPISYTAISMPDGTIGFYNPVSNLNILPYITEEKGGDLSVEFTNPLCIAYVALYSVVMYAGDAKVRAVATASLIAAAAIIYAIASYKNRDFEICGVDWLIWGSDDEGSVSDLSDYHAHYPKLGAFPGSKKYDVVNCSKNVNDCLEKCEKRKKCFENYAKNAGKLKDCLEANLCPIDLSYLAADGGRTTLNMNDKIFRERFYDGEEIMNEGCYDPREEAKKYDVNQSRVKAGKMPYQLYYMRGYNPGNYACDRFLVEKQEDGDKFDEAYKCCIKTSDSVCIKDKMSASIELRSERVKFCPTNQKICKMHEFVFEIFPSNEGDSKYCARTYTLCPYNFNIQMGTEKTIGFNKKLKTVEVDEKVDSSCTGNNCATVKVSRETVEDECYDETTGETLQCQGQIKNFHQYNRHCTVIEKWVPKYEENTNYAPYVDRACINFVGSSHNTTGYATYTGYEKMFSQYKSFTAPVSECLSETLKNFLFNRAGHTKCAGSSANPNEKPDLNGKCKTGYEYTEGDDLTYAKGIKSPTSRLLSYIHTLIMLAVIIMITLYGYNILINSGKLDRKDMLIAMLKVVFVITFSVDTWWYDQMFKFTYAFSNTFSTITQKIGFDETMDVHGNYIKYDGCYFGDINNILGKGANDSSVKLKEDNNYYLYPKDRRYVAFFDSLDCKVTRYIGYSVGSNVPNLISFLGATLIWPFNIGIFLGVATLMLALFAINFAIKAVYIFVMSAIAMAIMLYVAPIIIPCILFKKTKSIFDKWLKNLIGFALQPMIMFAFISMALTIMDKYTLGEGIYTGSGLNKELVCGYSCINSDTGAIIDYTSSRAGKKRTEFGTTCGVHNKVVDLKRNSLLCFLDKMTTSPWAILHSIGIFLPTIADIFFSDVIMFLRVAFLFFILTKVLESIPTVATTLVGGKGLETNKGDPFKAGKDIFKLVETVKRGVKNAGQKLASKLNKKKKDDDKKQGSDDKEENRQGALSSVSVRKRDGGESNGDSNK